MRLLILLSVVLLSSCNTAYVIPKTPCPPTLVLPELSLEDLAPLSEEVYTKLNVRDTMLRERVKTLTEAFCKQ